MVKLVIEATRFHRQPSNIAWTNHAEIILTPAKTFEHYVEIILTPVKMFSNRVDIILTVVKTISQRFSNPDNHFDVRQNDFETISGH